MDDAWVCTIGSMAARILRENAFEVGIDPKFEVIDEAEASYLRAEATEQVLAHLEAGADPLLRAVIDEFGLRGQGPFDKRLLEHTPRRWWPGCGRCPRGSRACACPSRPPRLRALCDRLWRLPGRFRRW
ncbi:MAG: hypothetical protein V8Q09_04400 [Adlercreutzia sp.]